MPETFLKETQFGLTAPDVASIERELDEEESLPPGCYAPPPDISHLITEDDEPVDNLFSEKQQRLLVAPLYQSWQPGRPFLAAANVGIFRSIHQPAIVPDMFLSLDVTAEAKLFPKKHRSYFMWEYGKPPEVVVEIASNRKGGELAKKRIEYAQMGIPYYVVYDPFEQLQAETLTVFVLNHRGYTPKSDYLLEDVGLSLTICPGIYEQTEGEWLRWCDLEGRLILLGDERAEHEHQRADQERQRAEHEHQRADQERQRAEHEHQRADQERQRAEQEHQRAELLAAKLRELGLNPEQL